MKNYHSLFDEYHSLCGWFKDYNHQDELFGCFQALPIPGTKSILCNAFSQRFYSDTKYEIVPEAWEKVLRKVISQNKANYKKTGVLHEFHCPFKIGIGMKPFEIDALKEIVDLYFKDSEMKWIYHI